MTLRSSNSLSLLPSEPKIFHGRDSEVIAIVQLLAMDRPRVVILGGAGMGKTTLARIILHHPSITAKYQQARFFVSCETATTSVHLAAQIGAHVGLNPGQDPIAPVISHFSGSPPSLLILDNVETIWESRDTRGDVEKFLGLLAAINHLALIITMRGAEHPANVQWTHPFLEPLKPLAQEAARKTFIDIVDDGCSCEDIDEILRLADNMPLAIDLLAHLVDYEGFSSVMHRWEMEGTSLLAEGYNKGSNLEVSISLSLDSPRLASVPHSRDLLSLLSMLPDGLADVDLMHSNLPMDNILSCKTALLRTTLAYKDDQNRLKVLGPIREYIHRMLPPGAHIVQSVLRHFNNLLEVHETYHGNVSNPGIVARIASNTANIEAILVTGLKQDNPDLVETIQCICHFDRFTRLTGHGRAPLINHLPNVLPHPKDYRLEVYVITTLLSAHASNPVPNAQHLIDQALEYCQHFNDSDLQCRSYVNHWINY
ncbi:hypothetical protein FB451DRAFT_1032282 [Mycena latifolia]|nr:hypothetical protein FB451DRAFT_1032282 [Mycena latifolia]